MEHQIKFSFNKTHAVVFRDNIGECSTIISVQ